MNRLMLDFETLDVAECPVILSMGAVFNEDGIVDCIFEKIDQQSCIDLGCTDFQSNLALVGKQTEAQVMLLLAVNQYWLCNGYACRFYKNTM
jgi:hypothetical protein